MGQLGKGLMKQIGKHRGRVVGTDITKVAESNYCDVTDKSQVLETFKKHQPTHVIHLSAILSGAGEKNPDLAHRVNVDGFLNVLEAAKTFKTQLFSPSTIAAFGPETPPKKTPDVTVMRPTSMYGITKVHMELMGQYYRDKYGVDFRSLRLPGVISPEPIHGMGTTDYAVEIFQAVSSGKYQCYLEEECTLPMVYIDDCLRGIMKLIESPQDVLSQSVYNINGLSFSPKELWQAIQKRHPQFHVTFKPDFRQSIAVTWPHSLKDTAARKDWAWRPTVNTTDKLVETMLNKLAI